MPPINIGLSDYSIEYFGNAIGSNISAPYIRNSYIDEPDFILSWGYVDINGIDFIRFGNNPDGTVNQVNVNFKSDNDAPFHLFITRQGLQIKIYINGSVYAQLTLNHVFDMKNIELIFINSSNIGLVRVWNYALSADEIATLYNNGDPMGYVVPKAMRGEIFSYLSDFSSGTDGWKPASGNELSVEDGALVLTGSASPLYMINSMSNNDRGPHIYSVELVVDTNLDISQVTCFAFQDSSPGRVNNGIDNGDGTTTYSIISPSKSRTYKSTFQFVFDMTNVSPVKIRSIKLKTALCLAEYLPQNLVSSSTDKTIATTWLDSAKQLPWSDAYNPPLLQSKGGYDMVANGAPEVLFNE